NPAARQKVQRERGYAIRFSTGRQNLQPVREQVGTRTDDSGRFRQRVRARKMRLKRKTGKTFRQKNLETENEKRLLKFFLFFCLQIFLSNLLSHFVVMGKSSVRNGVAGKPALFQRFTTG